ncbi:MAG: GTP 3',8-cyclase MoaA [Anaerolineales bacterium]|nr:GTP 3',8-cyclase MoaA [Chloroflexota bacterium]MBL6981479.1 GTP 3',8-cyclase MoaA [Anaerolineales bacterium]
MKDKFGRPLRDLRISVTDRCNFRCSYCMPKEIFGHNYEFLPRADLLTFEEITRVAHVMAHIGIRKIRLTGGEPLLRRDIEILVRLLAQIPNVELAMTTNASILEAKAHALKDAGLNRITVSLDALDEDTFKEMNDADFPVQRVLDGIQTAADVGFSPIKINMVIKRGVNEKDILPMARYFHGSGHILRFIEFMDVGSTNDWRMDDVIPAQEIVDIIHAEMPIEPIEPNYQGEVANRWRYKDGGGEVGVIASVTQPFCGNCTRLRLSAKGELYTCLFGVNGHDLRSMIRAGASDQEISERITNIWQPRQDRYSEIRSSETSSLPKVEMSYIGG